MNARRTSGFAGIVLCVVFALMAVVSRAAENCAACGQPLGVKFYNTADRVLETKVHICLKCGDSGERCFMCGVPATKNPVRLQDTRILCERDAKTAILDEKEGEQICKEAIAILSRMFSKYMEWPANATPRIVDRNEMETLFKTPGYES